MSALLRAARYAYGVIESRLRELGAAARPSPSNQQSCINHMNRRGAPAHARESLAATEADARPVSTVYLTRPAPAGSPRRASSRPRAPGPPRRASPPRGRSRRSPRSSRCGRTASSCRSWSRPWSGCSTRRRRCTSSRSRPSSWRSPASSRPRRGRGLPLSAKTGIVYYASLPPRTSGSECEPGPAQHCARTPARRHTKERVRDVQLLVRSW